ncbi:MAG: FAD-dependent oxidoreductase [Pseudomonadota bacterium]|nr:FAD-dependent oxidoreductase [Pseudomonadota bacterium]
MPKSSQHTAYEFDFVVAGSGGAGLTAAIVAALSGLKVLLIEKTQYFGGTTALSGGGLWIPNNPHMADNGLSDSFEEADRYLRNVLGNDYNEKKVHAFRNRPVRTADQATALAS